MNNATVEESGGKRAAFPTTTAKVIVSIVLAIVAILCFFAFEFVGVGYGSSTPIPSLLILGHVICPVMEASIFLGGDRFGLIFSLILESIYIYCLISLVVWVMRLIRKNKN